MIVRIPGNSWLLEKASLNFSNSNAWCVTGLQITYQFMQCLDTFFLEICYKTSSNYAAESITFISVVIVFQVYSCMILIEGFKICTIKCSRYQFLTPKLLHCSKENIYLAVKCLINLFFGRFRGFFWKAARIGMLFNVQPYDVLQTETCMCSIL